MTLADGIRPHRPDQHDLSFYLNNLTGKAPDLHDQKEKERQKPGERIPD
jgi:hypothetical protein